MKFTSRPQAMRSLRYHALAIFALGLAAEEASRERLTKGIAPARRERYVEKTHGHMTAVLWSEGVRQWAARIPNQVVRVHEPYRWTELIIGPNHIRFEREDRPAHSGRKQALRQQVSDAALPGMGLDPTVVYFMMTYSDVTGLPSGLLIKAVLGKTALWSPIRISRAEGLRQLASWRRRDVTFLRDMDTWVGDDLQRPQSAPVFPPTEALPAPAAKSTIRPGRRAADKDQTATGE